MREIKFRKFQDGEIIYLDSLILYKKTENLMQYTGLKDQEGNEVYEGDIFVKLVSYLDINSGYTKFIKEYCVVEFIEGSFKVYQKGWGYYDLKDVINMKNEKFDKWESGIVIGNIYENKELLEG